MQYSDFRITFVSRGDDRFEVIANAPAGQVRGELELPFDLATLGKRVRALTALEASGGRRVEDVHLGEQLFRALFRDRVADVWHASMGQVLSHPERGLRVRLQMDLDDPQQQALGTLPWELMKDPAKSDFLVMSPRVKIARFVEVDEPCGIFPLEGPLNVLVAHANPRGTMPIDAELVSREREQFQKLDKTSENVSVTFLDHASLASIRECLDRETFHIFHYLGHGSFKRSSGEGELNLEADSGDGSLQPVTGKRLAFFLRQHESLRLVVLNACKSAQIATDADYDPFRGVAASMVSRGMPAVVAMQFVISVEAAVAFSRGFYGALALTGSAEMAMSAGRKEIYALADPGVEWGTPVLFSREESGTLFDRRETSKGAPDRPVPRGNDAGDAPELGGSGESLNGSLAAQWISSAFTLSAGPVDAAILSLREAIDRLEDLPEVDKYWNRLRKNPASATYQKYLGLALDDSGTLNDAAIKGALLRLHQVLNEEGKAPAKDGIQQSVQGNRNIFSGSGNVTIKGGVSSRPREDGD